MLLPLALLFLLAPSPSVPTPRTVAPLRAEDLASLEAEYTAAVDEWRKAVRAAETVEARRKLRAENPAARFWPRYRTLADSGEGRALLWMVRNVEDAGLPEAEVDATREALARRLLEEHVDQPWFDEALDLFLREKRKLGLPFLETELVRAADRARTPDAKAGALGTLGNLLSRSKDEAERKRGIALLERVAKELPETRMGQAAADKLFIEKNLVVGAVAPDFEGKTIDGKAFELSDHRGKVVVLEFFGFW